MLLMLMAVAVLLILSGAGSVGFIFGLVVAGLAGVLLLSAMLHEAIHSENRARPRARRAYRAPHARGY
jgi:hypothetical protein